MRHMNCDQARPKLSELLDGTLPARAAAALKGHLAACAGCRREKALLALAVEGLSLLPARRPSAAFDARVLAAASAARHARPRLAVWAMNAAASATILWTAVLAAFARPRLSVAGAVSFLHILRHPASALSGAELRLAEAGLSVPEGLRAARHAASVVSHIHIIPGSALAVLPLQCMAAALIAGIVVVAAARPRPNFAVSRRIR
jgi:predicted anti-sigma-YlaC factor YlaD